MLAFFIARDYTIYIEDNKEKRFQMKQYKELFKANSLAHAQNVVASLTKKGTRSAYDKNTFIVYLVRTAPTQYAPMFIKGERKQYTRA
jgi:hypothetical protein